MLQCAGGGKSVALTEAVDFDKGLPKSLLLACLTLSVLSFAAVVVPRVFLVLCKREGVLRISVKDALGVSALTLRMTR